MIKRLFNAAYGNILLRMNGPSSDEISGVNFNPYKKKEDKEVDKDAANLDKNVPNDQCPYILRDFMGEFKDEYYFKYSVAYARLQVRQSLFRHSNFQIIDNPTKEKS